MHRLAPTTDRAKEMGRLLRKRRREYGITQRDLAETVGATASFISHLECGRTRASLALFQRISRALGVSVSYFLEAGSEAPRTSDQTAQATRCANPRPRVVRPSTRKVLIDPAGDGIRWELLSPDNQRSMEFIMGVYEPGGKLGIPDPIAHAGEECGLVLEGELELTIAGEVHRLKPGDSIYFDSSLPHSIRNVSQVTARAIWVISPPAF